MTSKNGVNFGIATALVCAAGLWFGEASAQQAGDSLGTTDALAEVVVTAEKRDSTVQKTPISLTAISGDQLQAQGTSGVLGIIAEVPGISMRYQGPGQTELEIRGLASSGGASPTVGFYLDETPLSPAAGALVGKVVIDPDLFDLNRVEVLRGPQGTLYGSGSMGGTVRLITNQPNLQKTEANVEATFADTPAGGFNPGFNAMFNAPLVSDTLALRIVLTDKYTAGWINREVVPDFPQPVDPCGAFGTVGCIRGTINPSAVSQVIPKVNWERLTAGRAALLYKPSEDLSINVSGMYQSIKLGGYNEYDQSAGADAELHYQPFDFAEPFNDTFRMVDATAKYNLGFADLTSATSYWRRSERQTQDDSEALEAYLGYLFGSQVQVFVPIGFTEEDDSNQLSEELRLSSSGNEALQWVGGIFYSKLESIFDDTNANPAIAYLSTGGAAANPAGIGYDAYNPYHLSQYAVFGEASYKFADVWKLTTGLRWYDFETQVSEMQSGIGTYTGNASSVTAAFKTTANGLNPKINLSYEPTDELTVYGSASKGFRPGGVNLPIPTNIGCNITQETYLPDSIWNYEIGEKAKSFDRHLTVNSDLFYIDWKGVQQQINQGCGYALTANAGNARSYGAELEIATQLTTNLTLSVNGAYTRAELTSVNADIAAADSALVKGSPILNIPKYTEGTALTYHTAINSKYDFSARLNNSYVGRQTDTSYAYQVLPAYDLINLRLGAVGSEFSMYLFANNLTDKRAALGINTTAFSYLVPSLVRVATNLPRTFGITLNYRFQGK
jgi:iron complex outermembrane recepter protein